MFAYVEDTAGSRGRQTVRDGHQPEPGWGNLCTPRVSSLTRSRAGARPRPRGCTVVCGLSGRAPTCPGRRAGPREGPTHGLSQDVESAAEQATCVATESTPQMRVYAPCGWPQRCLLTPATTRGERLGLTERPRGSLTSHPPWRMLAQQTAQRQGRRRLTLSSCERISYGLAAHDHYSN